MLNSIINKIVSSKNDILSGLTVSLALVPEAIAFAFVAGVPPLVGLYAAFFIGLITSAFGGRPGMISGATGALAVVLIHVVTQGNALNGLGLEYLFATVILAGLIQILIGVLGLGRLIRLMPSPVMIGFVNGLAIVIFLSQLEMFHERVNGIPTTWLTGDALYIMIGLVLLTMAIIYFLPKLTRAIPSSLAAILIISAITVILNINTQTVGNLASVAGDFPLPHLPSIPLSLETFQFIMPYAVIIALIGVIESLMTLQLIDELTNTRGVGNRECIVQGIANIVTGFFKGMGGCAMIGQSLINIKSGGRGRLSGITASIALLFFIVAGSTLIDQIPIASLVGVMFMVVIGTFEWATFKTFKRIPKSDIIIILIVTIVTVWQNLAIAVISGVIVSALVFAWKSAQHIAMPHTELEDKTREYRLYGLLYFGSAREFSERLHPSNQPDNVIINLSGAKVCDFSGIEALGNLANKYREYNKNLQLRHLNKECKHLLTKAIGFVHVEMIEDKE